MPGCSRSPPRSRHARSRICVAVCVYTLHSHVGSGRFVKMCLQFWRYSSTGCSTIIHLPCHTVSFHLFACRCGNLRRNRRNRWQNYVIGALPHPPTPEMMALCHWLHDREHCRALIYAAHASAPKIAGHCGGSRARTHTQ